PPLCRFSCLRDTAPPDTYTLSYTTLFRSQKIEAPADRLAPLQNRARLDDVPAEAIHLFADVESLRDEHELLLEALGLCLHVEPRSEEHTSELQSRENLVCRLLLEKKKKKE